MQWDVDILLGALLLVLFEIATSLRHIHFEIRRGKEFPDSKFPEN